MKITFTPDALEPIQSQCGPDAQLKLVYDSEGCGCAVSGVPTLWQIDQAQSEDIPIDTNAFQLYYEERQAVFFENELTIDYIPATRSLRLKSNQQMYNGSMLIVDKRVRS